VIVKEPLDRMGLLELERVSREDYFQMNDLVYYYL
jgi:hypothetical protein